LWTTSDKKKSIYDPCPSGWRVPDDEVWLKSSGLSLNSGYAYLFNHTFDSTNWGMNFSGKFGSASNIWYPASGLLWFIDGSMNEGGCYWSASPNGEDAYSLYIHDNGEVLPNASVGRALGQSVRCLRE
jgi:uncharacterized protein (TIGR02145 family)